MLDSYIYWMILILFFDDGTMKTSNTHPNRQQIPQHWHQETADTSKMRELESLLYLRKQKVIKNEYQYLALTMPLKVFHLHHPRMTHFYKMEARRKKKLKIPVGTARD